MAAIVSFILRFHFRSRYSLHAAWGVLVFIAGIFLFSIILRSVTLMTSPVGWDKEKSLTPAGYSVRDYSSASRGQLAALIIEGEHVGDEGIFVQISVDGAVSFRAPVTLSSVKKSTVKKPPKSPSVAISRDGICYAAWQEYEESSSRFIIKISSSGNFGAGWEEPETVDFGTDIALIPKIFFDEENRVHLFYHAFLNDTFNLFHTMKEGDQKFSKPYSVTRLSAEMRGAFFPSIVVSGRYIFVAWQGKELMHSRLADDIYFMRSTNHGRSFSSAERITSSEASDASPFLYLSENTLYCAYENNENKSWEIRLVKSTSLGETWDKIPLTVTSTNANCYSPSIASVLSDEISVFWYDNREGNNRIFTRRVGVTDDRLSREVFISEGRDSAIHPEGISFDSRILVMWMQGERIKGKFTDVYAEAPVLFSRTHPEGKWVKTPNAVIEWTPPADESGIAGYATLISKDPLTSPTIQNLGPNTRSETVNSLTDGLGYYHIRMIDGAGNFSRTVHYPLRVSASPLPIPVIDSKSHPERKSVSSDSPSFIWQISDIERVKGFFYSLSLNFPSKPVKYTEQMSASFADLPEGRYFFRVQAIDKTNTPGRIADYEFIIGQADELDPSRYQQFAQGDEGTGVEPVRKAEPQVILKLLDPKPGSTIEGTLTIKVTLQIPGIFSSDRIIYEIRKDGEPFRRGAFQGDSFTLKGLPDGRYSVNVKARYYYMKGRTQAETKFQTALFMVRNPVFESPFVSIEKIFGEQAAPRILVLTIFFILMTGILVFNLNRRLLFFFQWMIDRIVLRFRIVFSRDTEA
jgi:hypothetical protein